MKKLLAFILVIACALSLASCGALGGKDYKKADKTFEFKGFEITLTEAFRRTSSVYDIVDYESTSETSVTVIRLAYSDYSGLSQTSAYEYAKIYSDEMESMAETSTVRTIDGMVAVESETEALGFEFTSLSFVYKGTDALWVVDFMCDLEDFDEYEEYFVKWAKTAVVP